MNPILEDSRICTYCVGQWPVLAGVQLCAVGCRREPACGESFMEAIRTEALARGSRSQLVALDPLLSADVPTACTYRTQRSATAEAEKHAGRCPSLDLSRRRRGRHFFNLDARPRRRRCATLIYAAPLIERNCDGAVHAASF